MRFLVDAQLPPALAKWIADNGHSASAVRDQGLRNSDDGSIVNSATASDWVVVTIPFGVMNLVGLAFNSLRGAGTPVRPATSVVGTACVLVS
jgi:predicted nuclease of predicted toxin-antitoxin system